MWKRIIAYIVCVLVTMYLFVMYDSPVLSAALVLEVLYPLTSFILLNYISKKIVIVLVSVQDVVAKKQDIQIDLEMKNRAFVWNINYELLFWISQREGIKKERKYISGTIAPKANRILHLCAGADYCGKMEIYLEKIRVYDFIGFFYRSISIKTKKTIVILPQFEPIQLEITRRTREFRTEANAYSEEKCGDDSTEVYQIREYRPWDSVHHIHWKMTAKEDRLMVKEYSFPLGCSILIWLDLSAENHTLSSFEQMVEKVASLSITLLLEKCFHMVSWFEEENSRIKKKRIYSEEDMYELIYQILELRPYKNKALMEVFYDEAFKGLYFSSIVTIKGDGEILVNGDKQEILQL